MTHAPSNAKKHRNIATAESAEKRMLRRDCVVEMEAVLSRTSTRFHPTFPAIIYAHAHKTRSLLQNHKMRAGCRHILA